MQVRAKNPSVFRAGIFAFIAALAIGMLQPAEAQTQRPPNSSLQWRYISYDYAVSRGATFKLAQRTPPCPYTIRAPETPTPAIEVSIDCRARPTRGRFDFRFFENHILNAGWVVNDSDIGYIWQGPPAPGRRPPQVGFTRQPVPLQRNPRMDFFVDTPPNSQVFVRVRLMVKPGLLVRGEQHSNPLFRCERSASPTGPAAWLFPATGNSTFRCDVNSDCTDGFACGHPVCGANLCFGPRTGPG